LDLPAFSAFQAREKTKSIGARCANRFRRFFWRASGAAFLNFPGFPAKIELPYGALLARFWRCARRRLP
jgi:hypothetical protein